MLDEMTQLQGTTWWRLKNKKRFCIIEISVKKLTHTSALNDKNVIFFIQNIDMQVALPGRGGQGQIRSSVIRGARKFPTLISDHTDNQGYTTLNQNLIQFCTGRRQIGLINCYNIMKTIFFCVCFGFFLPAKIIIFFLKFGWFRIHFDKVHPS